MRVRPGTLAGWTQAFLLLFLSAFFSMAERALAASRGGIGYIVSAAAEIAAFGMALLFLKIFRNYTKDTLPLTDAGIPEALLLKMRRQKAVQEKRRETVPDPVDTRGEAAFVPGMDEPLPPPQVTVGMQVTEDSKRLARRMEDAAAEPPTPEEIAQRRQEAAAKRREDLRRRADPALKQAADVSRKTARKVRELTPIVRLRVARFSRDYLTLVIFTACACALLAFILQYAVLHMTHRTAAAGIAGYTVLPAMQVGLFRRIVALVIVPAVLRELFFRGALFSLYEQYGTRCAVLLTAVGSMLFARSPETAMPMLVCGIAAGVLTYQTRSVWPAVFLHMLVRGYALFVTWVNVSLTPLQWQIFIAANVTGFLLFAYLALRAGSNRAREGLLNTDSPNPGHPDGRGGLHGRSFAVCILLFAVRTVGQAAGLLYW